VKHSLFTLWTADLMLEREDARTHTLQHDCGGEKGRAGRGSQRRAFVRILLLLWTLGTGHSFERGVE
jgi:hypothetical protein